MTKEEPAQSFNIPQIDGTIDHYPDFKTKTISNCHSRINDIYVNNCSSPIRPLPSILLIDDDTPKEKEYFAQSTTHSGYHLKKSQSVKLTRIDQNDSYQKKAVRFADDFGLDLSQIKMIQTDELPSIPTAAFKHLKLSNNQNTFSSLSYQHTKTINYMEAEFDNPMYTLGFNELVHRNKVVLEQANAIDNRIYGTIRLISFGLNKHVKIRLTTNNWISHRDYDAVYIENSYDGLCDRFSFVIEIESHRICAGNNIQFCICYQSFSGQEYWDNNYKQNYRFNCYSRTIPVYSI